MKILWVKSGPLFPLNTGGRRRTHSMLREIAKSHEVTYLAMLPVGQSLSDGEADADYSQEKIWISTHEPREGSLRFFLDLARNFFLSTRPYTLDKYANTEFVDKLVELTRNRDFDLIVCDFLYPAVNVDHDQIEIPTVLFQHNVESQIWKRLALEKKNLIVRTYFWDQYKRMWRTEKQISKQFQGITPSLSIKTSAPAMSVTPLPTFPGPGKSWDSSRPIVWPRDWQWQ